MCVRVQVTACDSQMQTHYQNINNSNDLLKRIIKINELKMQIDFFF